jgi:hypothetical protein
MVKDKKDPLKLGKLAKRFFEMLEYQQSTQQLGLAILMPVIIGLVVGSLLSFIGKSVYGDLPRDVETGIFSVGSFICGFSGLPIITRKEFPGTFRSIEGVQAVMIGIFVMAFFWGLSLLGLRAILR